MDLYAAYGVFLLVSHADGHDHLWRLLGVCYSDHAPFSLCPAPSFSHGSHDPGAAPLLWHCMLDRYKGMGWKKPFLIYGMCDETFALIFAKKPHPTLTQAGSCFLLRCLTTRTGLQAQPLAAFLVPSFPLTQKVLTLS